MGKIKFSSDPLKFDDQGNVLDYYGNTTIAFVSDKAILDIAKEINEKLSHYDFYKKFSMLPIESLHMTLYSLIRERDRNTSVWPSYLEDFDFKKIDSILKERVNQVSFPDDIKMRVVEFSTTTLHLEPLTQEVNNKLNKYRTELRDVSEIDHGDIGTYTYHISLSYVNQTLSDEDIEIISKINKAFTEDIEEKEIIITISNPKFVIFNNMLAYYSDLSKRGNLY
ncbi:DUF1868 domain-containing protein [Streptococcus halichoeri]|uniref:DUF1868 domain-containing protein n=1 Tax=Streptococcus halichoeri TaxID=254785 RepID=UPI00135946C2|nr:DUF1868 domain-containing protein [Streptococcus halichoeri]